jgi:predicted  nucleic acid-binding Zn-ribbon protein
MPDYSGKYSCDDCGHSWVADVSLVLCCLNCGSRRVRVACVTKEGAEMLARLCQQMSSEKLGITSDLTPEEREENIKARIAERPN